MKPLTDQDRAILAKHATGATFREIAAELSVTTEHARRVVEYRGACHAKGQKLLAIDPENLEGLRLTGVLNDRTYHALAEVTYHVDVPDMERLSEVAAQGRECVARFKGIGPRAMAELDALLTRFGLTWNPRPRPFAMRTKESQHPLLKSWDADRERSKQDEQRSQYWSAIVRQVEKIERDIGTGVLKDHPNRDCMECVGYRLSFLAGYIESWSEYRRTGAMRDITPESDDQDDGRYETAGNLICLPGVKLADVRPNDGDRPTH